MSGTALVLAGGGVAGLAWELGVLRGIADADADLGAHLMSAEIVVGTSAGSAAGAQITSGVSLDDLYAAQLRDETAEIEVDFDPEKLFADLAAAMEGANTEIEIRQRIGVIARATTTIEPARRLAVIDARLPVKEWPENRRLEIVAVDAESGEVVRFTEESGVSLRDAVAASCAVPGVWPAVEIQGRFYLDGGMRSLTNADYAAGCERVVVIRPVSGDAPQPVGDLDAELAALGPVRSFVISADAASVAAFGLNPLSPKTRRPAAEAGRAVGAARASDLAAAWS